MKERGTSCKESVKGCVAVNRELFKCNLPHSVSLFLVHDLPLLLSSINAMTTTLIDVVGNEDVTFHIASFLCPRRNPSTLTEFYSNECLVSKVQRLVMIFHFASTLFSSPDLPYIFPAMEQCIRPCKSTATLGLSPKTARARRRQRLVVSQAHLRPKRLGSTRWWR